jgi:hypothetical protein
LEEVVAFEKNRKRGAIFRGAHGGKEWIVFHGKQWTYQPVSADKQGALVSLAEMFHLHCVNSGAE